MDERITLYAGFGLIAGGALLYFTRSQAPVVTRTVTAAPAGGENAIAASTALEEARLQAAGTAFSVLAQTYQAGRQAEAAKAQVEAQQLSSQLLYKSQLSAIEAEKYLRERELETNVALEQYKTEAAKAQAEAARKTEKQKGLFGVIGSVLGSIFKIRL